MWLFFNKMQMSKGKLAILLIVLILIADQIIKIWVKTHMMLGEEISVLGNWCNILFTENNGMAFGMEFFGKAGKYILSIFRIVSTFSLSKACIG